MVAGLDPAEGAEVSDSVPAGAMWLLRAVVLTLVTNATVGSRRVTLRIRTDGTSSATRLRVATNLVQIESTTREYHYFEGAAVLEDATVGTIQAPLPSGLVLLPGGVIETATDGLVTGAGGDNFGAPTYYVEEWS